MSFRNKNTEEKTEPVIEVVAETTAITPATEKTVAVPVSASGDVRGEFGISDIKLPYLKIVQKISNDAERFGAGSILFNGEVKVGGENQPFSATFLSLDKMYEEKLPMDAQKRPLVFDKADDVIQAGGSFNPNDEHYFQDVALMRVVIEKPENASDQDSLLFPYKAPNGKWYAQSLWSARGTSYSQTGPVLYTASMNFLANGLYRGQWAVSTEKRTNSKGSWHIPSLRFMGEHEEEMQNFFLKLRGSK
jgi:hypothetical protein